MGLPHAPLFAHQFVVCYDIDMHTGTEHTMHTEIILNISELAADYGISDADVRNILDLPPFADEIYPKNEAHADQINETLKEKTDDPYSPYYQV